MAGKSCKSSGKGKPKDKRGKHAAKTPRKPRPQELREKPGLGGSY